MADAVTPILYVRGGSLLLGVFEFPVASVQFSGSISSLPSYKVQILPDGAGFNLVSPSDTIALADALAELVGKIDTTATLAVQVAEAKAPGEDTFDINLEGLILEAVSPSLSLQGKTASMTLDFSHPAAAADHAGFSIGMTTVKIGTNSNEIIGSSDILQCTERAIEEALNSVRQSTETDGSIEGMGAFRTFIDEQGTAANASMVEHIKWDGAIGFPVTSIGGGISQALESYLPIMLAKGVIQQAGTPLQALQMVANEYRCSYDYQPWDTGPVKLRPANPWSKPIGSVHINGVTHMSAGTRNRFGIGMYNVTKLPVPQKTLTDGATNGASIAVGRFTGGATQISTPGYYGSINQVPIPSWVSSFAHMASAVNSGAINAGSGLAELPVGDGVSRTTVDHSAFFADQTKLTNHFMIENFKAGYIPTTMSISCPALPSLLRKVRVGRALFVEGDADGSRGPGVLYRGYVHSMSLHVSPSGNSASLNIELTHAAPPAGVKAIDITADHFTSGREELLYNSN